MSHCMSAGKRLVVAILLLLLSVHTAVSETAEDKARNLLSAVNFYTDISDFFDNLLLGEHVAAGEAINIDQAKLDKLVLREQQIVVNQVFFSTAGIDLWEPNEDGTQTQQSYQDMITHDRQVLATLVPANQQTIASVTHRDFGDGVTAEVLTPIPADVARQATTTKLCASIEAFAPKVLPIADSLAKLSSSTAATLLLNDKIATTWFDFEDKLLPRVNSLDAACKIRDRKLAFAWSSLSGTHRNITLLISQMEKAASHLNEVAYYIDLYNIDDQIRVMVNGKQIGLCGYRKVCSLQVRREALVHDQNMVNMFVINAAPGPWSYGFTVRDARGATILSKSCGNNASYPTISCNANASSGVVFQYNFAASR